MNKGYYFNFIFDFTEKRLLANKLSRFLNGVISVELERHGFNFGNYSVRVCFDKVWKTGDLTLAGVDAFAVSVFENDEIAAIFNISIVSDKIKAVSVGNKTLYALDFETDTDDFEFTVADKQTSLSDTEAQEVARKLFDAFVNRFPIPCRVSLAKFPRVTFNISFSGLFQPPDGGYISSLIGYNAVARKSSDSYRVIVDADFGDKSIFALHEAVGNLEPVKDRINEIIIT